MAEPTTNVQKKEAAQSAVERTRARRVYTPQVDIMEKKGEIIVLADMPGVDESSVDITLENDVLTIYGKVEPEIPEGLQLALAEYGLGDYHRMFTVSNEIDRSNIKATVMNGVLRVTLPKAPAAAAKKITVKAGA